ncbi:hypothetical protein LU298_17350 [Komagataeibacter intermedius]|uniref:hypothetical protein n=1 Tax=Komagataeibacter intermedius TaxID=66229 RepID=UPI001146B8D7|nr:hypothetical protein [Komagataeibacter intermedius]MCF3638231.1 hypothetical protein [Komagataeibacter intermedius]
MSYKDQLEVIGATLYVVQVAERIIAEAIIMVLPDEQPRTRGDIEALSDKVRKHTLGQLLKRVRSKIDVSDEFDCRLNAFLTDRNTFVHHLLEVEGGTLPPPGPRPKTRDLVLRLYENSRYVMRIFGDLIIRWADAVKLDGPRIQAFRGIVGEEHLGISNDVFLIKTPPDIATGH